MRQVADSWVLVSVHIWLSFTFNTFSFSACREGLAFWVYCGACIHQIGTILMVLYSSWPARWCGLEHICLLISKHVCMAQNLRVTYIFLVSSQLHKPPGHDPPYGNAALADNLWPILLKKCNTKINIRSWKNPRYVDVGWLLPAGVREEWTDKRTRPGQGSSQANVRYLVKLLVSFTYCLAATQCICQLRRGDYILWDKWRHLPHIYRASIKCCLSKIQYINRT